MQRGILHNLEPDHQINLGVENPTLSPQLHPPLISVANLIPKKREHRTQKELQPVSLY